LLPQVGPQLQTPELARERIEIRLADAEPVDEAQHGPTVSLRSTAWLS